MASFEFQISAYLQCFDRYLLVKGPDYCKLTTHYACAKSGLNPNVWITVVCFSHLFIQTRFYMFTIDDGWHGENNSILVVDNRINWFVLYNRQVVSEVAVLQ